MYTSQLLRGAFDTLMTTVRDEAKAGLHIGSLTTGSFTHFFRLATWFMQYCRYQEEKRVGKSGRFANAPRLLALPRSLTMPTLTVTSALVHKVATDGRRLRH